MPSSVNLEGSFDKLSKMKKRAIGRNASQLSVFRLLMSESWRLDERETTPGSIPESGVVSCQRSELGSLSSSRPSHDLWLSSTSICIINDILRGPKDNKVIHDQCYSKMNSRSQAIESKRSRTDSWIKQVRYIIQLLLHWSHKLSLIALLFPYNSIA